ncbi:MAG: peroxide stress protein YaaA, partial [Lachnospiraceae bacterium]|nr:peroxide stress protein YaaA [Lachnospiraceae bacterium]
MKIIISPAKKMNMDTDTYPVKNKPVFLSETEYLLQWMQQLSYEGAKKLWRCNDKLAWLNYDRIHNMNLQKNLTAAICSYEGLQYQYMAPNVFSETELSYVQEHLRILSGFYGVLRPFDGVTPYRLEMQAKVLLGEYKDLYGFWGDKLYREVADEEHLIINLASKEYSKCIENHLQEQDRFITCVFGEKIEEKVIQKGTMAKMARGEMVRFLVEHCVKEPEELKEFMRLGYRFSDEDSGENE